MTRVQIQGVRKVYPNGVEALYAVDLDVADGELLAVVGPSGSGKSTLARLVAGLESISSGSILIDGREINNAAPRDRDVAMVFQNPALYPHLNVEDNLAFGCVARGLPRAEVAKRVVEAADLLKIGDLLKRRPATLSGGQRQRVAIGRAIARHPRVLLLDEPLTGLDAPLRLAIRADLVALQQKLGLTTLFVTHDQSEALAVGHRLAVFAGGRLLQVGTPASVYSLPNSRFVGQFLGYPPMNIVPVRFEKEEVGDWLCFAGGRVLVPPFAAIPAGSRELGLRAEQIRLDPESPLIGFVQHLEPLGHEILATIDVGGIPMMLRLPSSATTGVGDRVGLHFDLTSAVWFS